MKILPRAACLAVMAIQLSPAASAQDASRAHAPAPPANPAVLVREQTGPLPPFLSEAAAPGVYSIGQPSDEAQMHLELINRARANPQAEAARLNGITDPNITSGFDFFKVNRRSFTNQYALVAAAPPLAFNATLATAAARHAQDLLTHNFQSHTGTDNSTPDVRVVQAGYLWSNFGENVYSYSQYPEEGHASFIVDWGDGPTAVDGMQVPPGHRNTIHNAGLREVGITVLKGVGTPKVPGEFPAGPQVVVEDFATAQSTPSQPFLTGVVYLDLNGNNFYDIGEGLGGVTVSCNGSTFTAVSAESGGYTLPFTGGLSGSGDGAFTVTFSGLGISTSSNISVVGFKNVKQDLILPYSPPAVTGPASPPIGIPSNYSISSIPGASGYQWAVLESSPPAIEGAENGTSGLILNVSSGYEVLNTAVKKSGARAFHLLHPGSTDDQFVEIRPDLFVSSGGSLTYSSRIGWATRNQFCEVQISTDNGASWAAIESRPGPVITDSDGNVLDFSGFEEVFSTRFLSLNALKGSVIRLRFAYLFRPVENNVRFEQADQDFGWYFDDITFASVGALSAPVIADAPAGLFSYAPAKLGSFLLEGRALFGSRSSPFGPPLVVKSAPAPPSVRIQNVRKSTNGALVFDVIKQGLVTSLAVEFSETATGGYAADPTAIETIASASSSTFAIPSRAGREVYYRVKVN